MNVKQSSSSGVNVPQSSTDFDRPWETHPLAITIHETLPSGGNQSAAYNHSRISVAQGNSSTGYNHSWILVIRSRISAFPATIIHGLRPSIANSSVGKLILVFQKWLANHPRISTVHGKLILWSTLLSGFTSDSTPHVDHNLGSNSTLRELWGLHEGHDGP